MDGYWRQYPSIIFDKYENVICVIMAFNFNSIKTDSDYSEQVILNGAAASFLKNSSPFEVLNAQFHKSFYYRSYKEDLNPFGYKNFFWLSKHATTEPRKYFDMLTHDVGFKTPHTFITQVIAKYAWEDGSENFELLFLRDWKQIFKNEHRAVSNLATNDKLGLHYTTLFEDWDADEVQKLYDHFLNIVHKFQETGLPKIHMQLLRYYTSKDNGEFPAGSVAISYSPDNGMYVLISNDLKHRALLHQYCKRSVGYPNLHFSFTGLQNYMEHFKVIQDNGETALKKFNDLVNKKILKNYGVKIPAEYFINHEETDKYYKFFHEYKGSYRFNDPMGRTYLTSEVYKFYNTMLRLYDAYARGDKSYKYQHHFMKSPIYTKFNLAYMSDDGVIETYIEEVDREQKTHRHIIKVLK